MKADIDWRGRPLRVDFSRGRSLAIAVDPRGQNPSFFSDSQVTARPVTCGSFVGDMQGGSSCNAEVIEFSAHSHGTHTECIGHINPDRQAVIHTIDQRPTLLCLHTVPRESLEGGCVIPEGALGDLSRFDGQALALRTEPNDESKQWRDYSRHPEFPVLSPEAMRCLSASPLLHLLLDAPSLDRSDSDELSNHAAWWGMGEGVSVGVPDASLRSVTEMIFVPDDIPDGDYWFHLELAPIVSDAVPSRPIIFPLEPPESGSE